MGLVVSRAILPKVVTKEFLAIDGIRTYTCFIRPLHKVIRLGSCGKQKAQDVNNIVAYLNMGLNA